MENVESFNYGLDTGPMYDEAWESLRKTVVQFRGRPVGTIAALDVYDEKLNYDQVFVRDFVSSGLAFLMASDRAYGTSNST
ncbi:probable alkaline/neutral invertase B [Tanacetum coccineum]